MNNTEIAAHKRVLLLINPKARNGSMLREEVVQKLKEMNCTILNEDTKENAYDPNEIILKHKDELDAVIIGGGDGSVNTSLPALKETRLPLLVIPLGTANNLARHYSIPSEIDKTLELLSRGKVIEVDLGEVNDILFVNVAGLGLSTEVNLRVSSKLKKHLGVLAFVITAAQLAPKLNPFRAVITTDKKIAVHTKSWQISVCNGKHYGAGMTIKHNATLDDGKLHLLSTEVKKWWNGLLLIKSFMTGHYKKDQEVTILSARELRIETRRKFSIDVDGDIKTTTPAIFRVLPKALRLIIPEGT
jgi:YegS/Rv2252/BmrU family lipid kinase